MSSVVFNYGLHQLQACAAARRAEINRTAMFSLAYKSTVHTAQCGSESDMYGNRLSLQTFAWQVKNSVVVAVSVIVGLLLFSLFSS